MSIKATLRNWLAAGEIERVIEALQSIAEHYGDKYFQNDVTYQAGRFNSLQRERQNGTISNEDYAIQLNNIRLAIQDLVDKVPANATLSEQTDPPEMPQPTLEKPNPPTPIDTITPATSPHIPWLIGLLLLLGAAIALIGFVPCPTAAQETIFRLLMAIGAGGVATLLPGLLSVELPGVKAGSAIGVFALVYLVNPAQVLANDSRCNKAPFEFTISLQADKTMLLSSQYPELEEAVLQIRLDNKWEDATIDTNGDADYKSIPGVFKNQTVAAQLKTRYWKLAQDTVTLSGKSQTLTIMPDGTLRAVTGKVRNQDGSEFLSNVIIEIEGILDTTDARGNFNITLPPDKQKNHYIYIAQKKTTKPKPNRLNSMANQLKFDCENSMGD